MKDTRLDITEAKHAEDARRQSEERFRALVEHSNDIIMVVQPDGLMIYRASSQSEGRSYGSEDLLGQQLLDLVHPSDVETMAQALRSIGARKGQRATGRSAAATK